MSNHGSEEAAIAAYLLLLVLVVLFVATHQREDKAWLRNMEFESPRGERGPDAPREARSWEDCGR